MTVCGVGMVDNIRLECYGSNEARRVPKQDGYSFRNFGIFFFWGGGVTVNRNWEVDP